MLAGPTYDRPTDALGRGHWATEPWVIITVCATTVVLVVALVSLRLILRMRKKRMGEAPTSGRFGSLPPPRP